EPPPAIPFPRSAFPRRGRGFHTRRGADRTLRCGPPLWPRRPWLGISLGGPPALRARTRICPHFRDSPIIGCPEPRQGEKPRRRRKSRSRFFLSALAVLKGTKIRGSHLSRVVWAIAFRRLSPSRIRRKGRRLAR